VVSWALLISSFLFALIVCAVRFWVLPSIETYREPIAQKLTEAIGQRVTIGNLEGRWSGVNLQLTLNNLVLFDKAGEPALKLERVSSVLSWWSLVLWEPQFDSIGIEGPDLDIRRDDRGVIAVAGIELNNKVDGSGLSDWLLRQDEITIRGATIRWNDALRGAPSLALTSVDFRLENAGSSHRFGLRAVPPEKLATPLDIRGELNGRTVEALAQWNGQLFVQLDYTDIAAWRAWVDFPVYFPHGAGAVRVWAGLKQGEPSDLTADVQIAQVKTRLGGDLRELTLDELKGRVGWKQTSDGFEVTTSKLGMSANALTLQPMDLVMRYHRASGSKPARGDLQVNALDFEPLIAFAEHLPFSAELRRAFDEYAPRGSLYDVTLKWNGEWPQPEQYSVKARFVNLGLNAVGRIPGFQGVSGQIDGNEKSGTLYLNTQNAAVDLPLLFRERLALDVLTAQVGWTRSGAQYEVKLNTVAFSNTDVAGSIAGSYQTAAAGPGSTDITAALTRAEVRSIARYLPVPLSDQTRQWLEGAFQGGVSKEVKLRLRGNLNDFPFPEGRGGLFEVGAKIAGGVLEFSGTWPRIENIDGDVTFRGRRMDIVFREATMLGAKLARVRAEIADVTTAPRVLAVNGDAEGPTAEFFSFIDKSPVAAMIDNFTTGMRAEGQGRLALKLTIPLGNPRETRVAGVYQFLNNSIDSTEAFFPAAEQINARLEFTDSSLRVANGTLNVLGGPASINATTQRDGTRINLAGRVNMENFRRTTSSVFAQALNGTTDWRASIMLRKQFADLVLESSLQGVASNLPAPFAKTAIENVPLRFERIVANAQQDRLLFSLGSIVSAQLQRRRDGTRTQIERGTVSFGGSAAETERRGVWVTGSIRSLDVDQWLALLKGAPASGMQADVAGLDLKFGGLDVFGRHFNELQVTGTSQGGNWQTVLAGRELAGDVSWRAQGRGKITARMKTLVIPSATVARAPLTAEREPPPDLPALEVTAEQFQIGQSNLGKLELNALPDGRDWKIERLRVSNADATLQADGAWQGWLNQPRTMLNVKLDVADIGKFLLRLGYPEGVRRGSAKLEGPLSWAGNPGELDFPSLSGNFIVEANKGQFVKLDPGVGKLLGILSLQSLPRRLSLDFRDIFTEGLAFDEIVGAVKVNRGIANTENLRIQGPAVRILMSGDVDLNAETQRLRVKVFPSVSDSLSVAGAFVAGPIAGIAAYVAQKLLKDPINQMAAYEYSVTGTWVDPQVVKVDAAHAAELDNKAGKAK
jgi:uncharacterized protein (TIGR02099 family)